MTKSKKSHKEAMRSVASSLNLPKFDKGWQAQKKNVRKVKWTSAPSRGKKQFDPSEAAGIHLSLKNYLVTRRLRVSRLPGADSVLEGEQINQFLDYLRYLEAK